LRHNLTHIISVGVVFNKANSISKRFQNVLLRVVARMRRITLR